MKIEDLINESKRMLLEFKPTAKVDLADFTQKYLEPPRIHKSFNLLAPVGYKWRYFIEEWYPPYKEEELNEHSLAFNIVVHGHEEGKVCQNRDLCHVLGFLPVGNEHPWFLKEWEKFNYDKGRKQDQGLEIDREKESAQGTLF